MNRILLAALTAALAIHPSGTPRQSAGSPRAAVFPGPYSGPQPGATLPNGWRITPAGRSARLLGDMPLKILVTPDRRYLLINTAGFHNHSLNVLDLKTHKIVQSVDIFKDWFGMCIDPKSGIVSLASGSTAPAPDILEGLNPAQLALAKASILRFHFAGGRLTQLPGLSIPGIGKDEGWITGLAQTGDGALFTLNMNADTVYKIVNDSVQGSAKVGYRPYAVAVSPDDKTLAVSNWGDRSVDLLDPATLTVKAHIAVGAHPNDLAYSRDGRLFVANANSNSVSVIRSGRVVETIKTSLEPGDPIGSTPDALALSGDGKRLYVANADNNDVVVVDTSDPKESRILGFIPTGWYPSALSVSPDGRTLFVGTAKTTRPNTPALTDDNHTQPDGSGHDDYIGDVLQGEVWTVPMPDAAALAHDTRLARANVPKPQAPMADAIAIQKNAFSKIKHVLYVIRENRTYDQIFGDMKEGNGDPSLTLFGKQVTPNAHALAQRYVLLDNLYANGEVSQDGHQWCNAAYATDFTEKAWETNYTGRSQPDADDRLTDSEGGYLWDNCRNHHVTYRSYGEYANFKSSPNTPPVFTGDKGLEGHGCLAWSQTSRWGQHDSVRAAVFIKEMRAAEATGQWPQFMVMHLAEDHTQGLQAGAYSPVAHVAANDQALGQIVDAISHSRFWKDTAIFVIEDDAQDGPDHVDCHRVAGMVISPYVRRSAVDHTMYSTASFVHTMELILGLPTMTQYDAAATPLYNSFTPLPLMTAYSSITPRVDMEARNPKTGAGAVASAKLDLTDVDRADPDALNLILWHALRPGVPMPAPVRGRIAVQ